MLGDCRCMSRDGYYIAPRRIEIHGAVRVGTNLEVKITDISRIENATFINV